MVPSSLMRTAVAAVLLASVAWAADPQPSVDAIVAIYNKKLDKGAWSHRTVTSTAIWTDRPTIIEEWERLGMDGTVFRRSETYELDAKGVKTTPSVSILNEDGDWAVTVAKKRAVRWPPPDSSSATTPPPADVMYFDPVKWKTLSVEKTKIEGKACWALISEVPQESRAYYAKQAETYKKIAGVESVDKFIPEKHRLVVDSGCTTVLAEEYVAAGSLVVLTERYRVVDTPPDETAFAIPSGYEKITATSIDDFFKATE